MVTNKRITKLTDYTSVLPYSSEMFGVYQPLIGWKSKRVLKRLNTALNPNAEGRFKEILKRFEGNANVKEIPVPSLFDDNQTAIARPKDSMQTLGKVLEGVIKGELSAEVIKELEENFKVDLIEVGKIKDKKHPMTQYGSHLLIVLYNQLHTTTIPERNDDFWKVFLGRDHLKNILAMDVKSHYTSIYAQELGINLAEIGKDLIDDNLLDSDSNDAKTRDLGDLTELNVINATNQLILQLEETLKVESAIAATLFEFAERQHFDRMERLFFPKQTKEEESIENLLDFENINNYEDPFAKFDLKKDIKDVSLSPLGMVHLYRQYFFELDSFLSTPVSHVWLSPGSSVELIETSTQKTTVEKTFETSIESVNKAEKQNTAQDDISESIKQNNKSDSKLGFSTTLNTSYATTNLSATASLSMDKTQEVAREQTNKRMRQQSEKASSEMKQNFKTTFKTITETTDTSSKRYVLNNSTQNLINYEMRRKMRQVGVQVQDIGTYLCWETFVDEPGEQLGLANLVHIAKPADLITGAGKKSAIENLAETTSITFTGKMRWDFDNVRQNNATPHGFVELATLDLPNLPDGYELDFGNRKIALAKTVTTAKNDESRGQGNFWASAGWINEDKKSIKVGIITGTGGLEWDGWIEFSVSGQVNCKLTQAKKQEVQNAKNANADLDSAMASAKAENENREKEAYHNSVKDRIKLASNIRKRKFEDLREEERIIVYRNLIKALMTEQNYSSADNASRHVLSELINSIFDVDKMLYFVAPEWWKARKHAKLSLGGDDLRINPTPSVFNQVSRGARFSRLKGTMRGDSKTELRLQNALRPQTPPQKPANIYSINDSIVNWSDQKNRPDNYFITEESEPSPMGSSLGWLLQLDGDDLRNSFLNAPWVKAVIPIRPGKELAAINWLKSANIEGATGLDTPYSAPPDELQKIKDVLLDEDPTDSVKDREVTMEDAIRKLCIDVKNKEIAANKEGLYPKEEIDDRNKVLSTPINKVYEHGFYPLKGGFKAKTEEQFEIISQWIEVVPTDQIVPVEVTYDPQTGRMNPAK